MATCQRDLAHFIHVCNIMQSWHGSRVFNNTIFVTMCAGAGLHLLLLSLAYSFVTNNTPLCYTHAVINGGHRMRRSDNHTTYGSIYHQLNTRDDQRIIHFLNIHHIVLFFCFVYVINQRPEI
jgi:hypothetical protein